MDDADRLEQAKARFLGRSGALTQLLKGLSKLPAADRPAYGSRVNAAKERLEAALEESRARIRARDLAWFDALTSGARSVGMPAPSVTVTALLVLAAIGLVTVAASAIGLSLGASGEGSGERSAVGAREPDEPAAAS